MAWQFKDTLYIGRVVSESFRCLQRILTSFRVSSHWNARKSYEKLGNRPILTLNRVRFDISGCPPFPAPPLDFLFCSLFALQHQKTEVIFTRLLSGLADEVEGLN